MKRMKMRRNIARAIAGPDLPSRREVEDHNLTHTPCRSWCNHCMRGGRRSAHKRRCDEGEGDLAEEGKEDDRDAEEGTPEEARHWGD